MPETDDGTAVVVLVAEDETLIRLLANDVLSEAGYRVLEARDGQEALTILAVHDGVQALFTDVNMPHVDGLSLAKMVSERWPHIGIVVTSGVAEPPDGVRFLRKPYTSQAMLKVIGAAIAETPVEASRVSAAQIVPTAQPSALADSKAQPLPEPEK